MVRPDACEACREVFAVEPLHGEVELASRRRAVGHVPHDGWVIGIGERLPLTEEALGIDRTHAREHL